MTGKSNPTSDWDCTRISYDFFFFYHFYPHYEGKIHKTGNNEIEQLGCSLCTLIIKTNLRNGTVGRLEFHLQVVWTLLLPVKFCPETYTYFYLVFEPVQHFKQPISVVKLLQNWHFFDWLRKSQSNKLCWNILWHFFHAFFLIIFFNGTKLVKR